MLAQTSVQSKDMLIKKLRFLQAKVITEFEIHWQMLMTYLIPLGQSLL